MVSKTSLKVKIQPRLAVPIYRQIINSILDAIQSGELLTGDRIPSLNDLCAQHGLSQDTVLKAYSELKSRGIITSSVGKGYYVLHAKVEQEHRVFLLFDKLASYKETLYEAFKDALMGKGVDRLYFHYNDPAIFRTLLETVADKYTEYVIVPLLEQDALDALHLLPPRRIFILDQGRTRLSKKYPGVWQDFEGDIDRILSSVRGGISRYRKLELVVRTQRRHYGDITRGFTSFCSRNDVIHEVVREMDTRELQPHTAYVVVDDRDLITLVKKVLASPYRLGDDIGIISYNESPLKEVIAGGITTISTDFAQMGRSLAAMILSGRRDNLDNPFHMLERHSFRASGDTIAS